MERVAGSGGRNRRYCSGSCKRIEDDTSRQLARLEARKNTECQWCFKLFTPKQKHLIGFCSVPCRGAGQRHLKVFGHRNQTPLRFCACGYLIQHDVGVSRAKPPRSKWCRDCREQRKREHDSQRSAHRQRKRRKAVSLGERFTKFDLYELYGSTCYLCGEPVSLRKDIPLTEIASIDHVIPIVSGGEHTMANCRLVHFVCNSRKGAKVLETVDHGR